jgi:hypothetical protein
MERRGIEPLTPCLQKRRFQIAQLVDLQYIRLFLTSCLTPTVYRFMASNQQIIATVNTMIYYPPA